MHELSAYGFDPFFERQRASSDDFVARVAAEHRGAYEVWSSRGLSSAQLAGRLRLESEELDLPGVGDWVILKDAPQPDRTAVIERVLERRTVFTRGAAGRKARAQVIAANVDLVFVVCGLDEDFNIHRIERYLARIWASGALPAVILNKADLCAEMEARRSEVGTHCPGVEVHLTSARHLGGIEEIRACVHPGVTVAFVGSSGTGKSTLVNALLGAEHMPTGGTRASDGRGQHTTTHRQLVLLPSGGVLLDTPGMRELQLLDDDGLDAVFEDVATLSSQCRFGDCRHGSEPGCAVRAAVESGALRSDRWEHYQKLEREAQAYERRHDAKLRRQSERAWGRISDQIVEARRLKGDK